MTTTRFQQVLSTVDTDLKQMRSEIIDQGEDSFDPFLFSQALTLKLRVAFQLIGKHVLEQQSTASDFHYQNEQWMGNVFGGCNQ
jgi:hypothetical protein